MREEPQPVAAHHGGNVGLGHARRAQGHGDASKVTIVDEPARHRRKARRIGAALAIIDGLGPAADALPFDHAVGLILAEAIRATDVFATSTEAIRRLTTSFAGTVRIAAVPSVTATLLPAAIAAFRASHPDVRLEISDPDSATVLPEGAAAMLGDAIGFVRPEDPVALRELRMTCNTERRLSPAAKDFWALLAKGFRSEQSLNNR